MQEFFLDTFCEHSQAPKILKFFSKMFWIFVAWGFFTERKLQISRAQWLYQNDLSRGKTSRCEGPFFSKSGIVTNEIKTAFIYVCRSANFCNYFGRITNHSGHSNSISHAYVTYELNNFSKNRHPSEFDTFSLLNLHAGKGMCITGSHQPF